jgi:hypothetical protein
MKLIFDLSPDHFDISANGSARILSALVFVENPGDLEFSGRFQEK